MNRNQFTFYRSYYEALKVLPKKEQAAVVMAICAYALDEEEPKLEGTSHAIFMLVRPTLDAGRRKAAGGSKGTPKKDTGKIPERYRKDTAKEKEGEIEKEREIENECLSPLPPSSGGGKDPHFKKPTLEEVSAYCRERRNTVDPKRWYDHYSSNGWRVGKNPMKDWKAAVRTWERSEINKPQTGFQTSNPFMEMLQEEGGNLF